MARSNFKLSLLTVSVGLALAAQAHAAVSGQGEAIARLSAATGGGAQVSVHPVTGAARFVRLAPTAKGAQAAARGGSSDAAKQAHAVKFLNEYAALFGIKNASAELTAGSVFKDRQGGTHLTHKQMYQGVPVFGAELKTHFDAADSLVAVNGTFIPDVAVDVTPRLTAAEAAAKAVARVKADLDGKASKSDSISANPPTLMVYREGLAKGVEGANRLAWEVQVGNRVDVREFVYVDAHSGKVIDKISGIHEAKNRRAFDAAGATAPGANYPGSPFWVEGQPFPTGTTEADNMIAASGEIYDLFKTAFGRDSYNGAGATMDSIFNRGNGCPNASWNGSFISFCPGTTTDDITAHEWGHAYTEYTHGLIYAWQPGALNESYSDIWGETIDRINGRGGDTPDAARSAGVCAAITSPAQYVTVSSPASIVGLKNAGTAAWGPQTFTIGGNVVGVGVGTNNAACSALTPGSLTGKIAFIDRGTCGFSVKALNAQNAGAIAAIIGNNQGATTVINMGLTAGSTPTIPSLSVTQNDGTAIKAALATDPVNVTLTRAGAPGYSTVRWLMGEDSASFGGAIRDMYNPTCFGNPGKVSDAQYVCTFTGDNGGVHSNSGVPNHAYALLVDGGTYNGQNVFAIGLTKAAHIYYRAQSVYQGPASGFPEHADAIEHSCADLTGVNLADLKTGLPSGEVLTASDCAQVAKAALAVEMRTAPAQCNFTTMLQKSPPPLCAAGTATSLLASDNFEGGKRGSLAWVLSNQGVGPAFTPRNFAIRGSLPGSKVGKSMYAADIEAGGCSAAADSQAGVQRLDSPEITVPAGTSATRMSFDHWVSTEQGWDGGNVKISVNGGAWQLVKAADFIYNPYNLTLNTAAAGNDNPMAGQPAFSGGDGGSVGGSWGRSIVNLTPYAVAGDKVKLRFELGNDCAGGGLGWFVDDVQIYRCTP